MEKLLTEMKKEIEEKRKDNLQSRKEGHILKSIKLKGKNSFSSVSMRNTFKITIKAFFFLQDIKLNITIIIFSLLGNPVSGV